MYTTGFLGQVNAMVTGVGNWFRAGAMALGLSSIGVAGGLAGCSGESPNTIRPLDEPDAGDTTIPDTPEANLDACLPVDSAGARFRVLVEADGARVGTSSPLTFGHFRLTMPAASLTILSGSNGQISFRGRMKWDSAPVEWATLDPSQASGPLAVMTQARFDGQPLTNPNMTAPGVGGPWSTKFPGFTDVGHVGFGAPVEGVLHYDRDDLGHVSNCLVDLTVRANAHTTSGFGPALDYFVLSLYPPRTDYPSGAPQDPYAAEPNFAGETPVILTGAIDAVLPSDGSWQNVCGGGAPACRDVVGQQNPTAVRARLVRNAATSAHLDGGADAMPHDAGSGG
jgi:hypothetical protein